MIIKNYKTNIFKIIYVIYFLFSINSFTYIYSFDVNDCINKCPDITIFQNKGIYDAKDSICQNVTSIKILEKEKNLAVIPKCDVLQFGNSKFNALNPAIIKTSDGFLVNCKLSGGHRISKIDVNNILISYDKDLNKLSEHAIIEIQNFIQDLAYIEDIRLFYLNDIIYLAATAITHDFFGYLAKLGATPELFSIDGLQRMCFGKLNKNNDCFELTNLDFIKNQAPKGWSKNWLPFSVDNNIYFICDYNPFTIIKFNLENYDHEIFIQKDYGDQFSGFRGSAPPIEFDNGYIFIVHEKCARGDGLYYTHRFIYMDKKFEIKKMSKPFYFKNTGLEFCCGLTLNHEDNKVIVSIGLWDREAYLCIFDKIYINSLLEDLD